MRIKGGRQQQQENINERDIKGKRHYAILDCCSSCMNATSSLLFPDSSPFHVLDPVPARLLANNDLDSGGDTDISSSCSSNALLDCVRGALKNTGIVTADPYHNLCGSNNGASFAVLQYMTPNLHNYGAYALACTALYCEQRGYRLLLYNDTDVLALVNVAAQESLSLEYDDVQDPRRDQRWTKVWLLHDNMRRILRDTEEVSRTCVESGAEGANYLVWMDSDLIVLDMHTSLARYTLSFPQAHLIISHDFKAEHGLVNSGFFIMRVSEWSLAFLKKWWGNATDRSRMADQGVFTAIYEELTAANRGQRRRGAESPCMQGGVCDISWNIEEIITILEPHALNSQFPAWYLLHNSHQVLHLAGVLDVYRRVVFRAALRTICDTINAAHNSYIDEAPRVPRGLVQNQYQYPHQLNLNRSQLWVLLRETRQALISRIQHIQQIRMNDPKVPVSEDLLRYMREQVQSARQLGYAPHDSAQRKAERSMWMSVSRLLDPNVDENKHQGSINWENVVIQETRIVTTLLLWVSDAWEARSRYSPQLPASEKEEYGVERHWKQERLLYLQEAIDSTFQLLDHIRGVPVAQRDLATPFLQPLHSSTSPSSSSAYFNFYSDTVARVKALSESIQDITIGDDDCDGEDKCETLKDNVVDEMSKGEKRLLRLCESSSEVEEEGEEAVGGDTFSSRSLLWSHRSSVLQALHYYQYKLNEYDACLLEHAQKRQLTDRRIVLLERALRHLECISGSIISTNSGGTIASDTHGPPRIHSMGDWWDLAALSMERQAEAVVVMLALAESLCNNEKTEKMNPARATARSKGLALATRGNRLLFSLWVDRTAPAEVKELLLHATELMKSCGVESVPLNE